MAHESPYALYWLFQIFAALKLPGTVYHTSNDIVTKFIQQLLLQETGLKFLSQVMIAEDQLKISIEL